MKYFVFLLLFCTTLVSAKERVISTTGNASETIALIGAQDKLIAVDTTSLLPADVMSEKPKIGYRRALSSEGILSLNPDLVILAPDAGPPEVVAQIESSGVPLLRIADVKTPEGIADDIRAVAKAVEHEAEGEALVAKLDATFAKAREVQSTYPKKPNILIYFASHNGGGQGMGKESAGDALIQLLGGENALDIEGIKPISPEALLAIPADVILVAEIGKKLEHTAESVSGEDLPDLAPSMAAQNGCLIRVDVMKSLGFGPSYADASLAISDEIAKCLAP